MFQLKPISKVAIPDALQKAERYRLLNEPRLAESICLDILEVEPGNSRAIVVMLLAITDQFGKSASTHVNAARKLLPSLHNEYERHYYEGLICERQGNAILHRGAEGDHEAAYEWLCDAMEFYERAEAVRPLGQDDSILRWNTCARMIMSYGLQARKEPYYEPPLE